MSLFEFIAGMISVILALAVAQLLMGLARLVETRYQVRAFLPHSLWYLNLFLFIFLHWWSLWGFRELDWNWLMFFYGLLAPTLLFFAATLITPQQRIDEAIDLRVHYRDTRRVFLLVMIAATVFSALDGPVYGVESLFNNLRFAQALLVLLMGVAWISPGNRIQTLSAAGVLAALSYGAFLRFLPDQLA
jgi:hypothetical protein